MDQLTIIIEKITSRYPSKYRDDLIQECWLKAWPILPKHDPDACTLETFLYKPLHGHCKRWLSKNKLVDNSKELERLIECEMY